MRDVQQDLFFVFLPESNSKLQADIACSVQPGQSQALSILSSSSELGLKGCLRIPLQTSGLEEDEENKT